MNAPVKFNRKSTRLAGHNYASEGAYYVTICINENVIDCRGDACVALNSKFTSDSNPNPDSTNFFGQIVNEQMVLNKLGQIVAECVNAIPVCFPGVTVDKFVVMPNHLHIIILIDCYIGGIRATHASPLQSSSSSGPKKRSLGSIVGSLKSAVSKRVNECNGTPGKKIWQRNYHDHVIRSKNELTRIRKYIEENPAKWEIDKHTPNE